MAANKKHNLFISVVVHQLNIFVPLHSIKTSEEAAFLELLLVSQSPGGYTYSLLISTLHILL